MPRDILAVCRLSLGVGCVVVALDGGLVSTLFALGVAAAILHSLDQFSPK